MSTPMKLWDPHFHIWDVREATASGHEPGRLAAPDGDPVYTVGRYEAAFLPAGDVEPIGGAWVEALSVCHVGLSGAPYHDACLAEARWAAQQLLTSDRSYVQVPSVPLEAPEVDALLEAVAAIPGTRGTRQILNHEPSWPRNAVLGDLLDDPRWRAGFARLEDHGLSFDLQLNPHQFAAAAALVREHPGIGVIINHLGSPTWADLTEHRQRYRDGMRALAACPNTSIKISMLAYAHADWDQQPEVTDTVHWIVDTFGVERCFFASNYPVDVMQGWPADRLFGAFLQLASRYSRAEQEGLFAGNARRAYRAEATPG